MVDAVMMKWLSINLLVFHKALCGRTWVACLHMFESSTRHKCSSRFISEFNRCYSFTGRWVPNNFINLEISQLNPHEGAYSEIVSIYSQEISLNAIENLTHHVIWFYRTNDGRRWYLWYHTLLVGVECGGLCWLRLLCGFFNLLTLLDGSTYCWLCRGSVNYILCFIDVLFFGGDRWCFHSTTFAILLQGILIFLDGVGW